MKIGVTARFLNSFFSGGQPQVALALARTCALAGHDVTLLRQADEPEWFNDIASHANRVPPRKAWSDDQRYDVIIEATWNLTPEQRAQCAKRVIMLAHAPPIFNDMESCVYSWNPACRQISGVQVIWTYDHYSAQDVRYMEFLFNVPVQQIPFIWDGDALDSLLSETQLPSWSESAKKVESMIPPSSPKSLSWCARVVENNFSNTSHCIMPLNIVSEIRKQADPVRLCVHNSEHVWKNEFFKTNVARNLLVPDLSGNMVPRVRLPDLLRDKSFLVAHQRFRPLKTYLLDALYLGLPMIHNCELVRSLGAPYYYELNQISQAIGAYKKMSADYESGSGFFSPRTSDVRKAALRARFSPAAHAQRLSSLLAATPTMKIPPIVPTPTETELRIAFCDMWDDFQPQHNFFTYLLTWVGKQNNIRVVVDAAKPNLVFFGPLSKGSEKAYPGVPKVYFTGENAPPNKDPDTFLNVGFLYEVNGYIRLPLWVLEVNWFGADPDKIVNPRPVSLAAATKVAPGLLENRQKFCAFVASNPTCQNRNIAFQILNNWKSVDAGGRLYCNLPGGPIPAGRGGGGGELSKVDFYKNYRFALTFENSSSPGYVTEKLFHAKVAGAVPIYWGDPFVDRDFDTKGFINANQVSSADDLIQLVKKVEENPEAWKAMASIPAVSEFKKRWCEKTMEQLSKVIFRHVLKKEVKQFVWSTAEAFGASYVPGALTAAEPRKAAPTQVPAVAPTQNRVFVTAANMKYAESAANLIASLHAIEPNTKKIVYVWSDVTEPVKQVFKKLGASEVRPLPTTNAAWPDFWEPQHFAWKLWIHDAILRESPENTCMLYIDAGTVVTAPLEKAWAQINTTGILALEDDEQINAHWCSPASVKNMSITEAELQTQQLWAGMIGYKAGSAYAAIAKQALEIAQSQRDTIVGEKWSNYSATCRGHRHDQSILSILTLRAQAPRLPLREFYTDKSMRDAKYKGLPLYVHRGNFKDIQPFADGIGEAFIINLERRSDRLERFRTSHSDIKDRVYTWKATDGRALQLTPDIKHLFRNNDFKWKKAVMGCALSHMGLWEKLANDRISKSYLILEDDVCFNDRWMATWTQAAQHIPADADVIYLGGVLPPNKPALPTITEPVNTFFARVAPNTVFGGGAPRRYFHFCNYSYVLTKRGAEKLMALIKDRGIFTSGDHMIVNHGDGLLNIYFTTPLLATCFQENDPAYIKSEFNNFSRVDNFDSDLWNNTDCFTEAEIHGRALPSGPAPAPAPAAPGKLSHQEQIKIWNEFLRHVALKQNDKTRESITAIFDIWRAMTLDELNASLSWVRIFEQLLLTKNETLIAHIDYILKCFKEIEIFKQTEIWNKVYELFDNKTQSSEPGVVKLLRPDLPQTVIWHLPEIHPTYMLELQWLTHVFGGAPVSLKVLPTLEPLVEAKDPILLVRHVPGQSLSNYNTLFDIIATTQKQVTVLHLSDEYANDDISWYNHKAIKRVIRNYWRPELASYKDKVVLIPLGYANGRHGDHMEDPPSFEQRNLLWSFAGSADRPGRLDALAALRNIGPHDLQLKDSWSAPSKLDGPAYNDVLRKTKFVPCLRGSSALESYRLYEALEHGAIPFYITTDSHGCADEYTEQFGKHPLLGFPSWEKAAELLPKLAAQPAVMEKHRQQVYAWWRAKKTDIVKKVVG